MNPVWREGFPPPLPHRDSQHRRTRWRAAGTKPRRFPSREGAGFRAPRLGRARRGPHRAGRSFCKRHARRCRTRRNSLPLSGGDRTMPLVGPRAPSGSSRLPALISFRQPVPRRTPASGNGRRGASPAANTGTAHREGVGPFRSMAPPHRGLSRGAGGTGEPGYRKRGLHKRHTPRRRPFPDRRRPTPALRSPDPTTSPAQG